MFQGGVVMLCAFFWVLLRWAREDTERHELLDFARERGIALDEARAARAAAAGRTAELRRRLAAGIATDAAAEGRPGAGLPVRPTAAANPLPRRAGPRLSSSPPEGRRAG